MSRSREPRRCQRPTASWWATTPRSQSSKPGIDPRARPGEAGAMAEHSELLHRFKPSVKYDSQEAFFADAVEMVTDGAGCSLRQEAGKVLFGGKRPPKLALTLLRDQSYAENMPVAETDRVCLA